MTTKTRTPKKRTAKASTAKARTAKIDPRLEARRLEVSRSERQRKWRTLIGLVAVTVAAVGSLALLDSSYLDVDEVVVSGSANSDPVEIAAQSGIELGQPLVEVDLQAGARRVEALPWVETAKLDRRWNGDVIITVSERQAVAALPIGAAGGGLVLIDQSGRQLAIVAQAPLEFMPIEGIEASGQPGEPAPPLSRSAMRLADGLRQQLGGSIGSVSVRDGVLAAELVPQGQVIFGDDSSLEEKILALETMLGRVDLRCLEAIDLRVPSAPALTRRSASGEPGVVVSDLATCV